MTHHPIRTEPDGTRVYSNGVRYKPKKPPVDRRGAVRFGNRWYPPLLVLSDPCRTMPETRPDTDAYEHAKVTLLCMCAVCLRPDAERWRTRWKRDHARGRVSEF